MLETNGSEVEVHAESPHLTHHMHQQRLVQHPAPVCIIIADAVCKSNLSSRRQKAVILLVCRAASTLASMLQHVVLKLLGLNFNLLLETWAECSYPTCTKGRIMTL